MKNIALFILISTITGCGATAASPGSTTPIGHDTVVLSRGEYDQYREDRERRSALIDGQISDAERQAALDRYVREHAPQQTEAPASPASPTPPRAAPPVMPGAPAMALPPPVTYAPPGMVTETQAFMGGSAPWRRYGASTGGLELRVRVNTQYAIALAIDGQMVQPQAGMPTAVPVVTGGGLVQMPVIPPTRDGGWRGTTQDRDYRILVDEPGPRQITWTCYAVASGRPGMRVGSGSQTVTVRTGGSVLYIADSQCH